LCVGGVKDNYIAAPSSLEIVGPHMHGLDVHMAAQALQVVMA